MADESDIDVSISFRSTNSPQPERSAEGSRPRRQGGDQGACKETDSPPGPSTSCTGRRARRGTPWWRRRIVFAARAPRGTLRQESGPAGPDAAHRSALNAALKETNGILARAGHPTTSSTLDAVSRTLAALCRDDIAPGRLTKPSPPAGSSSSPASSSAARRRLTDARPAPERTGAAQQIARDRCRGTGASRGKAPGQKANRSLLAARSGRTAEAALDEAEKEAAEAQRRTDKAAARVDAAHARSTKSRRSARQAARALADATVARDRAERRLKDIAE